VNPPGGIIHVVVRTVAVHHEFPGHGGNNIFHQRPREAEPAMIIEPAPPGECTLAQNGQGVSHAHLFQNIESGVMHALDISIGERLICAALK
jgi:hypothetical protein